MLVENLFPVCDEAGDTGGGGGGGAPAAGAGGASGGAAGGQGAAAGGGAAAAGAGAGKAPVAGAGAPAGGEAGAAAAAIAAAAGGAGAQPNPYQPNFKYKVLKEEKELPEWARPFVTTPELEKQFKDAFERADGIEAVKQHRDSLVQENTAMREEWQPVVQNTQTAMAHLQRGDMDSFFEFVGIPEVAVLKYALQRLQLRENPAALQQHEAQRQQALQHAQLQQQLQQATSGYQNLAVQTRSMQLDTHLQRPEILSAVSAFDARVGKPGAFRAEVVRRGQAYAAQEVDAPVDQLVGEILQLIGWQGQNPPPAAGQNGQGAAAPAAGSENSAGGQGKPPVLPHLRGKGASPVKKAPKSTNELREIARQLSR
jgi:hypothetical protein